MAAIQIQPGQLRQLEGAISKRDSTIQRLQSQLKSVDTQENAVALGVGLTGAAAFCFVRGKMEDKATGAWNIPGTQIDWEAVAVLGLAGLALGGGMIGKQFKKYEGYATNVTLAIGGHYVGQLARKFGRTGQMSMVAGMLPSPGAGANSISFRQTQIGPPYGDPIAEALAQSGL